MFKHTSAQTRLVLVDDGSTDPAMRPLLESYAGDGARVTLIKLEKNSGFVAAANLGLAYGESDVVLLNSDTQVTEGWLARLEACLTSRPGLGIVSPLSNNGFILSVPRINHSNELPSGYSVDDYAALVSRLSWREYPELPAAVGYCMWIRRDVLRAVGDFDRVFLEGYGEEMDFSYRAKRAGFGIACADDCFIFHQGAASFGEGKKPESLHRRNEIILKRYWPNYPADLLAFQAGDPFGPLAERITSTLTLRKTSRPESDAPPTPASRKEFPPCFV